MITPMLGFSDHTTQQGGQNASAHRCYFVERDELVWPLGVTKALQPVLLRLRGRARLTVVHVLRMIVETDKNPGAAVNDGSKNVQRRMMKKLSLRILVSLVGFAGLAVAAKAQVLDQIVVTIPFEFVAGGKTLPAGTYTVKRLSDDRFAGLVLRSFENRASAIVLPAEVESAPADKAQVSFETAGDQHFLSKIETADNVFVLPVSRAAILLASGKSNTGAASGSATGSN